MAEITTAQYADIYTDTTCTWSQSVTPTGEIWGKSALKAKKRSWGEGLGGEAVSIGLCLKKISKGLCLKIIKAVSLKIRKYCAKKINNKKICKGLC